MIHFLKKTTNDYLFTPCSAYPLALFRMVYGMMIALYAFQVNSPPVIHYKYCQPNFFFSFPLFTWLNLKPLSCMGMQIDFLIIGFSASALALGLFYRFSSVILFSSLTYIFLLEKTYSSNANYIYLLLAFLFLVTDAHTSFSLDAMIRRKRNSPFLPFWQIFIFRTQVCIAYFYSGIAKLTHKDWLRGKQFKIWLGEMKDHFLFGPIHQSEGVAYIFSYGGLVFELTIGFLICYRPTRWFGIFSAISFHLFNKLLLGLDIFPWFMITTLIVFIPMDGRGRVMKKISSVLEHLDQINIPHFEKEFMQEKKHEHQKNLIVIFLMVYLIFQLTFPLRHWLYPCDVNWTQRGQHFSWHFMNNNMDAEITAINYTKPESYDNFDPIIITPQQRWFMGLHPDCILQYARKLKEELKKAGVENPVITIQSRKSLNGRPYADLIDTRANLAEMRYSVFKPTPWVLPHPDEGYIKSKL